MGGGAAKGPNFTLGGGYLGSPYPQPAMMGGDYSPLDAALLSAQAELQSLLSEKLNW
jgi:hypothetical protein